MSYIVNISLRTPFISLFPSHPTPATLPSPLYHHRHGLQAPNCPERLRVRSGLRWCVSDAPTCLRRRLSLRDHNQLDKTVRWRPSP